MLQLFRTNQFAVNILLLFYASLLWFSTFVIAHPVSVVKGGALGELFLFWVDPTSTAANLIAIILVFFQAFLVNVLVSKYRMASELSLFPGVFYILLTSFFPDFLYLSPILIANTFLILLFYELFDTYRQPSSAAKIFNVGFFVGLASLIYGSYFLFIFLAIIALSILRAFRTKEIVILVIGLGVPYFLGGTLSFWLDQWDFFWQAQFGNVYEFLNFVGGATWINYAKLSFIGLLLLIVIFSYRSYNLKKNIRIQKNISIFYWALLIGALSLLVQSPIALIHLLIIVPVLAILLSFSFLKFSKPTAEALHLIFLICALLLQYKTLFLS